MKYAVISIGLCEMIIHGDQWSTGWVATAPGAGGWAPYQAEAMYICFIHWSQRPNKDGLGQRSKKRPHEVVPDHWERDDSIIEDAAFKFVARMGGRLQ